MMIFFKYHLLFRFNLWEHSFKNHNRHDYQANKYTNPWATCEGGIEDSCIVQILFNTNNLGKLYLLQNENGKDQKYSKRHLKDGSGRGILNIGEEARDETISVCNF